jgi:hypothetical protein
LQAAGAPRLGSGLLDLIVSNRHRLAGDDAQNWKIRIRSSESPIQL